MEAAGLPHVYKREVPRGACLCGGWSLCIGSLCVPWRNPEMSFPPHAGPPLGGKSWRPAGFAHALPLSFVGRLTPGTHSHPSMASLAPFQSLNPERAEQQHGPIPVQESGVCPLLPGRCQVWAGCLRGTEEGSGAKGRREPLGATLGAEAPTSPLSQVAG